MGKPKPVVVPSDDCTVRVGGEPFTPHEGETVTLYQGMVVGEWKALQGVFELQSRMDEIGDDPENERKLIELLTPHFQTFIEFLKDRVVAWDWTDDRGRPLPQPDGSDGPFQKLRAEELYWLLQASRGETGAARKNA